MCWIWLRIKIICCQVENRTVDNYQVLLEFFIRLNLHMHELHTFKANFKISLKTVWKKCCHDFIKIYIFLCLCVSFSSLCVCFPLPSSSKANSTTAWVSMWRTSLTNPTVWLPTIDGFITNTTLTTLDRYEREKYYISEIPSGFLYIFFYSGCIT